MKFVLALSYFIASMGPVRAQPPVLPPGSYQSSSGDTIYVGVERELPDAATNEYFNPKTQRAGDAAEIKGAKLLEPIVEDRRFVTAPQGKLGVSLYRTGSKKRAAVILIHGNDPETREMGFLIPYFVLNGIDVISYDQRGTGESTGNWWHSGPEQRAVDVEAIYDAFSDDKYVDAKRIGVWGFSNGGWTAPIVATQRPVAFMLLKSAPAESVLENNYYYVVQRMQRYHHTDSETKAALATWRTLIGAIEGTGSWDSAKQAYDSAVKQSWFKDSAIPPAMQFPLADSVAEGFRNALSYDPSLVLPKVRTPTLVLFGAKDRNVDVAHASATLRSDFARAGMTDFTMQIYPDAGHTLKISASGFNDDPSTPVRLAAGYPQVMLQWLAARGFL